MIRTVGSDLSPQALGHCQCHEHLFLAKGASFLLNSALRMDDFSASARELADYRAAGGQAIVDAQPLGCGRMAFSLARAAQATGVSIVASTGFHKLIFYAQDHWIHTMSEDALAALWASEIEEGMYDRGDDGPPQGRLSCRAGLIKAAVDREGPVDRYRELLGAACAAALRTNTRVMCHVESGADPLALLDFLSARGLNPGQVILCHLDRACPDRARLFEAARSSAFLDFDTIAREKYHSDEAEADLIEALAARGLAGRLMLSLDTTNQRLRAYGGATGLDYLITSFLPLLRGRGLDPALLRSFTHENPARALDRPV